MSTATAGQVRRSELVAAPSDNLGRIGEDATGESRQAAQTKKARQRRVGSIEMPLVCALIAAVLAYGFLQRNEGHISAETGIGYYLGIAGSLMMLALLLYPLRKRFRAFQRLGGVREWFRIHMLLGIFGPALIVLHSNFTVGSLNATVALTCMLVVAGSGFIGRFLYARIHRGLYGRKAEAREFLSDAGAFKAALYGDDPGMAGVLAQLQDFEAERLREHGGMLKRLWRATTAGVAGRRLRKSILAKVKCELARRSGAESWPRGMARKRYQAFAGHLDQYVDAIARTEAFLLYERLFSLWHMLHLPLFVILIFAALAHVLAVHLY